MQRKSNENFASIKIYLNFCASQVHNADHHKKSSRAQVKIVFMANNWLCPSIIRSNTGETFVYYSSRRDDGTTNCIENFSFFSSCSRILNPVFMASCRY